MPTLWHLDRRTNRIVAGPEPTEPRVRALDADTAAMYRAWRCTHTDEEALDAVLQWVAAKVSRRELLRLFDAETGFAQEGH